MKICYISYYPKKEYPRQVQFIKTLQESHEIESSVVTNQTNGIKGYLFIIFSLIKVRYKFRPDQYILGFRGNEIFLFVRLLTIGKPLIFDSFVPLYQAFKDENKWNLPRFLKLALSPSIYLYELLCLWFCQKILTDTISHKKYYEKIFGIKSTKIEAIYLGCPYDVPHIQDIPIQSLDSPFKVFFYGTMQPLHGINIILECAKELMNHEDIIFQIVGGKETIIRKYVEDNNLTNIEYHSWLEFDQLMILASQAHICIGGPLGGTPQATNVITGKTFQFFKMGKCTIIGFNKESSLFPFKNKKNCLIVTMNNITELTTTLIWSKRNKGQLPLIGENGKILFNKHFALSLNMISLR